MNFVVYDSETDGFRRCEGIRGVENVGAAISLGISVIGHPNLEGRQ
jgi:hypothetical protein